MASSLFDAEVQREHLERFARYAAKPIPRDAAAARDHAYSIPIEEIDVSQPGLFQADTIWPYFERLRREDPVHYCADSAHGPYWSITKYDDVLAVDLNHEQFSSAAELGGIVINGRGGEETLPMFIAMDPPRHGIHRKTVSYAMSPGQVDALAPLIRQRVCDILDALPIGEEFDWVDLVSKELTATTLATLFGFPYEQRRNLIRWSDVAVATPGFGVIDSLEQKQAEMEDCFAAFMALWTRRLEEEAKPDLISMLAHGPETRGMSPVEFFGNSVLLIVGGNDTTRSTITGSLFALSRNPDQFARLREEPALIPAMVAETIRWQTPLAHMRRTAVADVEFRGKTIRKGDKVVMWYVSANRDEEAIERPDEYCIERPRPRRHLSFGHGIHRCVGSRVAEIQLQIVWEEILRRFPDIEVTGEPRRVFSNFVRGYESLPVRIARRIG